MPTQNLDEIQNLIASYEAEIAKKQQQIELVERLFGAMRDNAEHEDRALSNAELARIEDEISKL